MSDLVETLPVEAWGTESIHFRGRAYGLTLDSQGRAAHAFVLSSMYGLDENLSDGVDVDGSAERALTEDEEIEYVNIQYGLESNTEYFYRATAHAVFLDEAPTIDRAVNSKGFRGEALQDQAFMYKMGSYPAAAATVLDSPDALADILKNESFFEGIFSDKDSLDVLVNYNLPYIFSNCKASWDPEHGGIFLFERFSEEDTENFIPLHSGLIDCSDANLFHIFMSADTFGNSASRMTGYVKLNGDTILTIDGDQSSFIQRTVDITEREGLQTLEFGYSSTSFGGDDPYPVKIGHFWVE